MSFVRLHQLPLVGIVGKRLCALIQWPVVLIASFGVTSLLLLAQQLGGLQRLELVAFDRMLRLRPDQGTDSRLLVVGITEPDIHYLKRWPLSDQTVAQVMNSLQQYQPKAIGLDLLRDFPNEPGVIGLTIPAVATSSTLQVGRKYRWTFLLICKLGEHGNDVQVDGTVQRVQLLPDLAARLAQVKERDRPSVYGEAGLWYDMLFTLAELRRTNPQDVDLTSDWVHLLEASGLGQVAQEPLVQLCQSEHCLTLPERFSDMRSDVTTRQN